MPIALPLLLATTVANKTLDPRTENTASDMLNSTKPENQFTAPESFPSSYLLLKTPEQNITDALEIIKTALKNGTVTKEDLEARIPNAASEVAKYLNGNEKDIGEQANNFLRTLLEKNETTNSTSSPSKSPSPDYSGENINGGLAIFGGIVGLLAILACCSCALENAARGRTCITLPSLPSLPNWKECLPCPTQSKLSPSSVIPFSSSIPMVATGPAGRG